MQYAMLNSSITATQAIELEYNDSKSTSKRHNNECKFGLRCNPSLLVAPLHDGDLNRQRLFDRLRQLAELEDDWDGEGSPTPSSLIVQNAEKLILALPWEALLANEDEEDLMPMPGGKLTLDWFYPHSTRRILSIEIAENGCGAYCRRPLGVIWYFQQFAPDTLPPHLAQALTSLH